MKDSMTIWAARDANWKYFFYPRKPKRDQATGEWWCENFAGDEEFPLADLCWEDEPLELIVKLAEQAEPKPETEQFDEWEYDLSGYRPFNNGEEFFLQMLRNTGQGWLKNSDGYRHIVGIYNNGVEFADELNPVEFITLLHEYEFADGTPVGIKK